MKNPEETKAPIRGPEPEKNAGEVNHQAREKSIRIFFHEDEVKLAAAIVRIHNTFTALSKLNGGRI